MTLLVQRPCRAATSTGPCGRTALVLRVAPASSDRCAECRVTLDPEAAPLLATANDAPDFLPCTVCENPWALCTCPVTAED